MTAPFESMTGFATFEREIGGKRFRLQAKSVNHRFLELKWRAPREWGAFETSARQSAQRILRRGSVEISIETADRREAASAARPEDQAARLASLFENALAKAQSATKLSRAECAAFLERTSTLWMGDKTIEEELAAPDAERACADLLAALNASRRTEGARLADLLRGHTERLGKLREDIGARIENVRETWSLHLRQRLDELSATLNLPAPNQEKLLQELLFLAERREVSEELGRITIHLEACAKLLVDGDPMPGKRLEFLAQELHREWTTLGNKVQDAELAQKIIDGKLEIEKIREQCLNLA